MKYSILIPTFNAGEYLKACVETIVNQGYDDYELLISDDHSTDGTAEILKEFEHPKIKVFFAPYSMSMSEHWEWLLSHASGEWIIFVGQDDGLQPYFFSLAEILTQKAQKHGVRTIQSRRSTFFWPGTEGAYGFENVFAYSANAKIEKRSSQWGIFLCLLNIINYFELPIMYTSSMFHSSILQEARRKQNNKVFVTHPQDSNLAALACSLDAHYLYSNIPIGFEGASLKSAGLAVAEGSDLELKNIYKNKVLSSKLPYCKLIGDFNFSSIVLYFWGSLIQTKSLRSDFLNYVYSSKAICYIVFISVYFEKKISTNPAQHDFFVDALNANGCSYSTLLKLIFPYKIIFKLVTYFNSFLSKFDKNTLEITVIKNKGECNTILDAYNIVANIFVLNKLLK